MLSANEPDQYSRENVYVDMVRECGHVLVFRTFFRIGIGQMISAGEMARCGCCRIRCVDYLSPNALRRDDVTFPLKIGTMFLS